MPIEKNVACTCIRYYVDRIRQIYTLVTNETSIYRKDDFYENRSM